MIGLNSLLKAINHHKTMAHIKELNYFLWPERFSILSGAWPYSFKSKIFSSILEQTICFGIAMVYLISASGLLLHLIYKSETFSGVIFDALNLAILLMAIVQHIYLKLYERELYEIFRTVNKRFPFSISTGLETFTMQQAVTWVKRWAIFWGLCGFNGMNYYDKIYHSRL